MPYVVASCCGWFKSLLEKTDHIGGPAGGSGTSICALDLGANEIEIVEEESTLGIISVSFSFVDFRKMPHKSKRALSRPQGQGAGLGHFRAIVASDALYRECYILFLRAPSAAHVT